MRSIVRFARVLRAAGLPVGTDRVLEACRAVALAGVGREADFRDALAAVFVSKHEHLDIFRQAFEGFWHWRAPGEQALPRPGVPVPVPEEILSRRVAQALAAELPLAPDAPAVPPRDRVLSTAADQAERLRTMDFASMSADEMAAAAAAMRGLVLPVPLVPVRRPRAAPAGHRIDLRATLRRGLRGAPALMPLRWVTRQRRHPPLVVLCDVSGSMQRYTRMFLHFLHAVANDRDRVHVFLFGTRLTNVSRPLKHRDVDLALRAVSRTVEDWSGGTRIAESLAAFNRLWARRVLGQNAVVLLITDGLERGDADALSEEAQRLRRSCHGLLWLNPLLRFDTFEPKAAGIRALLPHADRFLPAHNVASLAELASLLASNRAFPSSQRNPAAWKSRANK